MTERGVTIKIEKSTSLRVGSEVVRFVIFSLTATVPDDPLKQGAIRAVVIASNQNPPLVPLSEGEVVAYVDFTKKIRDSLRLPLFVLGSHGYYTPQCEGGFVATREIQPDGQVYFREHWALGGESFQWSLERRFIMRASK